MVQCVYMRRLLDTIFSDNAKDGPTSDWQWHTNVGIAHRIWLWDRRRVADVGPLSAFHRWSACWVAGCMPEQHQPEHLWTDRTWHGSAWWWPHPKGATSVRCPAEWPGRGWPSPGTDSPAMRCLHLCSSVHQHITLAGQQQWHAGTEPSDHEPCDDSIVLPRLQPPLLSQTFPTHSAYWWRTAWCLARRHRSSLDLSGAVHAQDMASGPQDGFSIGGQPFHLQQHVGPAEHMCTRDGSWLQWRRVWTRWLKEGQDAPTSLVIKHYMND